MSLYAVFASTTARFSRPCAMVEAVDVEDARRAARRLRKEGRLAFLPPEAVLTVRSAARREEAAWESSLRFGTGVARLPTDGPHVARLERRREAFFQKLWQRRGAPVLGGCPGSRTLAAQ